jgi:hypothetical protein
MIDHVFVEVRNILQKMVCPLLPPYLFPEDILENK